MTLTKSIPYIATLGLILAIVYLFGAEAARVGASAPSGLPATVATSSIQSVSSTALVVAATTTACSARIVSTTVAGGVMIGFAELPYGLVPSATQGHWQAASTTVAYDSGLYGCGAMRIYSGSPQAITVTETR